MGAAQSFDLVCIGSGPAGQRAAVQAAKLGKKVLIVEKRKLGGACLHTGTIPSKALREAALGISNHGPTAFKHALERTRSVIRAEVRVMQKQLARNHVEFATGTARFVSPHEIEICTDKKITQRVQAAHVLIGTGTSPRRPPGCTPKSKMILDTDSLLRLTRLPHNIAIVGAGVIGCEYASILACLGLNVTLFDARHELLRSVDREITEALRAQFQRMGIVLRLGAEKMEVLEERSAVNVRAGKRAWKFKAVLYCLGREGNTASLNLSAAGLTADARGQLAVNAQYQSTVPHIYAAGDVIGPPALAASSGEQGRLAACHMFGLEGGGFPSTFPYGIYTIPEISSAGAQEEELKKASTPFVVGRARYQELARGQILGDHEGLLKLLVHKTTHKILGVHVLGTGATELVHIGQVAIALGADVEFLVRNVFNYPTLAEAYKVAALNAKNQL